MKTSKTVQYVMTNGLLATHELLKKPTLVKVVFAIKEDDSVVATVESARNGSTIDKLGKKTLTREQLRDIPEDAHDNMVFNRAAFKLFGLEI